MFEKYIIVPGSLRKASRSGTEGFEIDLRIAYYRGLGLSMIEGFEVAVDGAPCSPDGMTFRAGGREYTFEQMAGEIEGRWEFNEAATLFVPWPHAKLNGEHAVSVVELLRVSYMPDTVRRGDEKRMTAS